MNTQDRIALAFALRLAAGLGMASMFLLAKLVGERGVSLPETMFWRQLVTLPMLLGWLWAGHGISRLRTRRLGSHMARAVMGTVGMLANFGAVTLLHLSEATTLNFTAPLFAVLITALVLREHVGTWRWLAVALGFAGVLLIARPGNSPLPPLGAAAGLAAALLNAVISFHLRDLGRTEEPICVVFWFAVFGSLLTSPFLLFGVPVHDATTWAMLLGVGIIGTVTQLLLTASLRYGAVASVIVMDYFQLLWSTLYGRLVWGDLPHPTIWLGAPLIVGAGLVIARREQLLARQRLSLAAIDPA